MGREAAGGGGPTVQGPIGHGRQRSLDSDGLMGNGAQVHKEAKQFSWSSEECLEHEFLEEQDKPPHLLLPRPQGLCNFLQPGTTPGPPGAVGDRG